jgi:hypothetical protein
VCSESRCALRLRYVDLVVSIDAREQHLLQVHSDFPNAELHKVFANEIKRVQACIDARGYHFQHLLQVHSDFPNALYIYNTRSQFKNCSLLTVYTVTVHNTPSKYPPPESAQPRQITNWFIISRSGGVYEQLDRPKKKSVAEVSLHSILQMNT